MDYYTFRRKIHSLQSIPQTIFTQDKKDQPFQSSSLLLNPKNLAPTRECKESPSRLTPFLCTWTSANTLMVTLASVSLPRASVVSCRALEVVALVVVRLAGDSSRLALVRRRAASGDSGTGKHTSMSESVVKKLFQS